VIGAFSPDLIRPGMHLAELAPVRLVQNDNLVPAFGKSDFLLGKHFDFIPHYIDAPEEIKQNKSLLPSSETNSVTCTGTLKPP
jgi:hypothetical protein